MLYRAIKYQVDKGPVDAVTGKAKRTLNDSHLLREDIDYCAMVTVATHVSPVCLSVSVVDVENDLRLDVVLSCLTSAEKGSRDVSTCLSTCTCLTSPCLSRSDSDSAGEEWS